MPANYVLLERIELAASAASVTFANIPQSGYSDLKVVVSTRAADSANNWYLTKIQFNTDTTSGNYSARLVGAFGSSAYSSTSSNYAGYIPSGARTVNTFGNNEIYIPNYTGSTAKSFSTDSVTEGNGSSFEILGLWAGLWSGTAAINQIVLSPDSGSWAANSTFSLYGLAALGTTPAIAPKASGGNRIDYDGTYWIHTFTSSGAFVPQTGLTCDYLVVAGGGGGGSVYGGGGGAGGLRSTVTATGGGGSLESALSVTSGTAYSIQVGAGGAGGVNNTSRGSSGTDSIFSTITSAGGGGGGSANGTSVQNGANGGSGGGGSVNATKGTGTANQGYDGANGGALTPRYGQGGGGGAGATGSAGTGTVGGAGGNGVAVSITGTSVTYAGGGGAGIENGGTAGTGGTGGGANGTSTSTVPTAATANTGGGGGGSGFSSGSQTGGAGGSGIVIIRYLAA